MKTSFLFVVILGAFMMPREASAAAIYGDIAGNNFGSGYAMGPGGGVNNAIAQGFTMVQDFNLASVEIVVNNFQSQAGSKFALSIYSDSSGNPGNDLYDLSTDVTAPAGVQTLTFSGTGSFLLQSGTTYWLDLYAYGANPQLPDNGNTMLWLGAFTESFSLAVPLPTSVATDLGQLRSIGAGNPPTGTPSITDQRTAFQLNAVPEPSSLALGALASLALLAVAARKGRPRR